MIAQDLIKAAFQEILVQGSEAPYSSDEYTDGMTALNNMMATLKMDGLDLSFTTVTALTDTVTVDDGALQPIIKNLAIRLATQFDAPISPALAADAKSGMNSLRLKALTITTGVYPETLPRGSGNHNSYLNDKFYPGPSTT